MCNYYHYLFAVSKQCTIEGFRKLLGVDCDDAIVVANIVGVGSFGVFMMLLLIFVKKR